MLNSAQALIRQCFPHLETTRSLAFQQAPQNLFLEKLLTAKASESLRLGLNTRQWLDCVTGNFEQIAKTDDKQKQQNQYALSFSYGHLNAYDNIQENTFEKALEFSVLHEQMKAVKFLLTSKFITKKNKGAALRDAVNNRNIEIAKALLESNSAIEGQIGGLRDAAIDCNLEMVNLLLSYREVSANEVIDISSMLYSLNTKEGDKKQAQCKIRDCLFRQLPGEKPKEQLSMSSFKILTADEAFSVFFSAPASKLRLPDDTFEMAHNFSQEFHNLIEYGLHRYFPSYEKTDSAFKEFLFFTEVAKCMESQAENMPLENWTAAFTGNFEFMDKIQEQTLKVELYSIAFMHGHYDVLSKSSPEEITSFIFEALPWYGIQKNYKALEALIPTLNFEFNFITKIELLYFCCLANQSSTVNFLLNYWENIGAGEAEVRFRSYAQDNNFIELKSELLKILTNDIEIKHQAKWNAEHPTLSKIGGLFSSSCSIAENTLSGVTSLVARFTPTFNRGVTRLTEPHPENIKNNNLKRKRDDNEDETIVTDYKIKKLDKENSESIVGIDYNP